MLKYFSEYRRDAFATRRKNIVVRIVIKLYNLGPYRMITEIAMFVQKCYTILTMLQNYCNCLNVFCIEYRTVQIVKFNISLILIYSNLYFSVVQPCRKRVVKENTISKQLFLLQYSLYSRILYSIYNRKNFVCLAIWKVNLLPSSTSTFSVYEQLNTHDLCHRVLTLISLYCSRYTFVIMKWDFALSFEVSPVLRIPGTRLQEKRAALVNQLLLYNGTIFTIKLFSFISADRHFS